MAGASDWIRGEAARLGLPLSEEDLTAIAAAVAKTRGELAAVRLDPAEWNDAAIGFLPLAIDPAE